MAVRPECYAYCPYCGYAFSPGQPWPRVCARCGQITFLNPIPVSVGLVPVDEGLLAVRRAIEPHKGMLALPGGYINLGETWQEAGAREVLEETGVLLDPQELQLFNVHSASDGTLLIFGLARTRTRDELCPFSPCAESNERVVITGSEELAFDLHAKVAKLYLQR